MNELSVAEAGKLITFSPEQVELLKRTVAKGATDDELSLFLHVCQKSGLDPFAKQIYAIKRKDRRSNVEVMSIQTGIDGYRVVAERTNRYAPGKEPSYQYSKDNLLVSATAYVNKLVGEKWFEVSATAFLKEYIQESNFMWQKMPHVMLAKCAEALALRRAFPNELSGLYTNEEMAQADTSSQIKMPQRKTASDDIPVASRSLDVNPDPSGEVREVVAEDIPFGLEAPPAPGEEDVPYSMRKINREQQKLLFIKMREANLTEEHLKKAIKVLYNFDSTKDLTTKQFDNLLDMIKRGAIRGEGV